MRFRDLLIMAAHNLWSRKLRTALNLLGVLIGCVLLIMTISGTRGVRRGIRNIMHGSDDALRLVIHRGYRPNAQVPPDVLRVDERMDPVRRARIRERLRSRWLRKNVPRRSLGSEELTQLRALKHVVEVIPRPDLRFRAVLNGQMAQGRATSISARDIRLAGRIIAGEMLTPATTHEILVSEFLAYELGYGSDDELQRLVGQSLELRFRVRGQRMAWLIEFLNGRLESDGAASQVDLLGALHRVISQVDELALADGERELIKAAFGGLSDEDATANEAELYLTESFAVRGVFRAWDDDDPFSFLRTAKFNDDDDICFHHDTSSRLMAAHENFESFSQAIVDVDSVEHLRDVVEQTKKLGFSVTSAIRIVERIDQEINKALAAISVLSLIVLSISAVGISNTMAASVLERTSEFGIMKSLGARDQHVRLLMLIEGTMTGVVGAFLAWAIAWGLSWGIGTLVRQYLTQRLGESYESNVFLFSPEDFLIVLGVAGVVCVIASILPAHRAARLDPVVAMRRM